MIYFDDGTMLMSANGLFMRHAGESFSKVQQNFNNIYFHPEFSKGPTGAVVAWDRDTFLRITRDNGHTWQSPFIILPTTFQQPAFEAVVLAGDTIFFAHSTGLAYTASISEVVATPVPALSGVELRELKRSGNLIVAAINGSTFYISKDLGATWNTRTIPFSFSETIQNIALVSHHIFVSTNGTGQGIWYSGDYGASWQQKNNGLETLSVPLLEVDNEILYALGTKPYRYNMPTEMWIPLTDPTTSERAFTVSGGQLFVAGETWSESGDGGVNWSPVAKEHFLTAAIYNMESGPDGKIYAGAVNTGIYRKDIPEPVFSLWKNSSGYFKIIGDKLYALDNNNFFSFNVFDLTTGNLIDHSNINGLLFRVDVEHVNNETFLATDREGVARRTGQHTWESFNNGLPASGLRTHKIGTDGAKLYLGTDDGLYSTDIAGDNWQKFQIVGQTQTVNTFIVLDSILIATSAIDYGSISHDYGATWQLLDLGTAFDDFNGITDFAFHDGIIYALSYRGLFLSFDYGHSWVRETFVDPGSGFYLNAILPTEDCVYIGTIEAGTWSIKKKQKEILSFATPSAKYFDAAPFQLTATTLSGLPVTFRSINPEIATISGNTVTVHKIGTVQITANVAGNDTYYGASVIRTLAVNKKPQTITFEPLASKKYTDPDFLLVASSYSGSPVTFVSSDENVASVNGETLKIHGIGTATIKARQSGTSNYLEAADVEQTLIVAKGDPVLLMTSSYGGVVGTRIHLSAKSKSTGTISFSLTENSGIATISGNELELIGIGTAKLTISQTGDDLYEPVTLVKDVVVYKPVPVVKITSEVSGFVGEQLALTTDTGGSTGLVTYQVIQLQNTSGNATVIGSNLQLSSFGIVKVRATVAADATYGVGAADVVIRILESKPYGQFIGTTAHGGINNAGVLYSVFADGTNFTVHGDFQSSEDGIPYRTELCFAYNGKFYGCGHWGGLGNAGTIFEYEPVNGTYVKLHDFNTTEGAYPSGGLTQGSNGKLYGTTNGGGASGFGVLFEFDPSTNTFAKLLDIVDVNGAQPWGGVTEKEPGKLLGLTSASLAGGQTTTGGVLFEYDIATGAAVVIHDFVGLSQILGFSPAGRLTQAPNGKFYGLNGGAIFEYDPELPSIQTGFPSDHPVGWGSQASLTVAPNGKLYALRNFGGTSIGGTLIEFDPEQQTIVKKIDFEATKGQSPIGKLLVAPDGKLYGVTQNGGMNNNGVLFQFDPATGIMEKKYDFNPATGGVPSDGLTLGNDGKLYGTTDGGGVSNRGVLYSFDYITNEFVRLIDFKAGRMGSNSGRLVQTRNKVIGITSGTDGKPDLFEHEAGDLTLANVTSSVPPNMADGLIRTSNGKFYGVTLSGGSNNGSLLEFDPVTNSLITKAPLTSETGASGWAALVEGTGGILYGTTTIGGANGSGTIFQFDPNNETLTKLYDLDYTTGTSIFSRMVFAPDGLLYGLATNGGPSFFGLLFSFDPVTLDYNIEHAFQSNERSDANLRLDLGPDGKLYFVVIQNSSRDGVLTQFDPVTGTLTKLADLAQTGLYEPKGSFQFIGDKILGSTRSGGMFSRGTMFTYDLSEDHLSIIHHFTGADGGSPNGNLQRASSNHITFAELSRRTFGDDPFELVASSTSNLPVTFTSNDPAVATIDGTTLTIVGAGTVNIIASQPGNDQFDPADAVSRELIINKADQVITIGAIGDKTLGDAPFPVTATSDANLSVILSTVDDGKIMIAGVQVTMVKAGRTSVVADQNGNTNYFGAMTTTRSFCIRPAKPTITVSGVETDTPVLTSSNDTGNQWYRNTTAISGATGKTLSVAEEGLYTVKSTVDDCVSELSNTTAMIITDILRQDAFAMKAYPSPFHHTLYVEVISEIDEPVTLTVTDIMGRQLVTKNGHSNRQVELDLGDHASGAYIVQVLLRNRSIVSRVHKK
jgi:uncharacterized repeat protein (TIGR03803 family)